MKKIVNILLILSILFSTSIISFADRVVRTDFPINLQAFSEEYNSRSVGEDITFRSYYYFDDPATGERQFFLTTASGELEIIRDPSVGDIINIPEGHVAGKFSMVQENDDPEYYKKPKNWYFGQMNHLGGVPRVVEGDRKNMDLSTPIYTFGISLRLSDEFGDVDWNYFPYPVPLLNLAALGTTISQVVYLIASSGVLILCFLILPILLKKILQKFSNL